MVSEEDQLWKNSKSIICLPWCFSSLTPLSRNAASLGSFHSMSKGSPVTLAALGSLRASAIRTAGTPSIHVHGLCTSRRETCLAERFHARKLVKMCPQPSNLALHSSSLVKPNSFSPMNRQISQLPPAHTTLQVRHCDFDRLTHLSFKAIQLLLSVHVHAECSHPSCCKKKIK